MSDTIRESSQKIESPKSTKTARFEVMRFNPNKDARPYIQTFDVPAAPGLTVLDGLHYIKEHFDSSLAWRSSCRMGVCGSCGMFINRFPRLACNTQIAHLGTDRLNIKPLPNYSIIKDLIPDLADMFEKHRKVRPYIIRHDAEVDMPTGEFFQTQEEYVRYIQFAYCIKCGICLAACPTVATDDRYVGPQALGAAERYVSDSRDEGFEERIERLFGRDGVWRCHFAGACSEACPKGVDPALGIQLLKREILGRKLGFTRRMEPAEVAPIRRDVEPDPDIPKPPERTVK